MLSANDANTELDLYHVKSVTESMCSVSLMSRKALANLSVTLDQ
jgi:hypothetical protein